MKTTKTTSDRAFHRAKLAAIPVLVIVLAIVVYQNFAPPNSAIDLFRVAHGSTPQVSPTKSTGSQTAPSVRSAWPRFNADAIAANDPFRPLKSSSPASSSGSNSASAAVPAGIARTVASAASGGDAGASAPRRAFAGKIHAIYRHGPDFVAIIDSGAVKRGDTLPDGQRVVEITDEAVIVQSAP